MEPNTAENVNEIVDNLAKHGANAWETTLQPLAETYVREYAAQAWVGFWSAVICATIGVILVVAAMIVARRAIPKMADIHTITLGGSVSICSFILGMIMLIGNAFFVESHLRCALAPTYHLTKSLLGN